MQEVARIETRGVRKQREQKANKKQQTLDSKQTELPFQPQPKVAKVGAVTNTSAVSAAEAAHLTSTLQVKESRNEEEEVKEESKELATKKVVKTAVDTDCFDFKSDILGEIDEASNESAQHNDDSHIENSQQRQSTPVKQTVSQKANKGANLDKKKPQQQQVAVQNVSGGHKAFTHYDKRESASPDYIDPTEDDGAASEDERQQDNNKSARRSRRPNLAQEKPKTENLDDNDYDEELGQHEDDASQLGLFSHTKTKQFSVNNSGGVQQLSVNASNLSQPKNEFDEGYGSEADDYVEEGYESEHEEMVDNLMDHDEASTLVV